MDQTPENSYNPVMNKQDFVNKYWFNSLQMVTVVNPLAEDFPFMVEMRHFIIKAGQHERFPGVIANVYLDQMSKIIAQNDDKLGFMADPALRRVYYDKLIIDVENLAPEYNPTPAWMKGVNPAAVAAAPNDAPPWESSMERARDIAPNQTPPAAPVPPAPKAPPGPKKPEAGTKEFELNGLTFSAVTDGNGKTEFFKNGKAIGEADYAKAASMIE